MPQTANVTGQFGTLTTAQSVTFTLFASVTSTAAEVPQAQCHYLLMRFFSGKNGTGTDLGQASLDVTGADVVTTLHAASLQDLVAKLFPPSSTQN